MSKKTVLGGESVLVGLSEREIKCFGQAYSKTDINGFYRRASWNDEFNKEFKFPFQTLARDLTTLIRLHDIGEGQTFITISHRNENGEFAVKIMVGDGKIHHKYGNFEIELDWYNFEVIRKGTTLFKSRLDQFQDLPSNRC